MTQVLLLRVTNCNAVLLSHNKSCNLEEYEVWLWYLWRSYWRASLGICFASLCIFVQLRCVLVTVFDSLFLYITHDGNKVFKMQILWSLQKCACLTAFSHYYDSLCAFSTDFIPDSTEVSNARKFFLFIFEIGNKLNLRWCSRSFCSLNF